ncbi:uroporphyrinogen-III C-methyltransferase [Furfurilactobacillus sp. WILCCON 0119]
MAGRVTLLGAGPGNVGYLTVLGQRRLAEADVVVYDHLVDPDLLTIVAATATLIDVGKRPYEAHISQTEINDLLVEQALAGHQVVRLKAGDPYVFGRGGEEAQYLLARGVDCEVVPGLTSAIAGLAAAGIPVTHRGVATSFHVITAHQQTGQPLNWPVLAKLDGTLIFLMGVAQLPTITAELIKNGRAETTPVAVVQWASQWRQQTGVGTLATIETVVAEQGLGSPALIVVGEVVNLAETLQPRLPLAGRHLLISTTAEAQLGHQLTDAGVSVGHYHMPQTVPVDATLPDWRNPGRLVFTSVRSAEQLLAQLVASGHDLRALAGWQLVATSTLLATRLQTAVGLVVDAVISSAAIAAADWVVGEQQAVTEIAAAKQVIVTCRDHMPRLLSVAVETFDGVVITSRRSLRALLAATTTAQQAELFDLPTYVFGEQLAETVAAAGFTNVQAISSSSALVDKLMEEVSG